ncbi:MAG: acyl-ACP--UDP-N-acetylglucosamine O-acyltransferase [Bacteroidales bacterium]|nr:acyl-ACP--UDP-N-acetylglucosamine O-acyltransferase [Bacteroidales bacterium]
MSISKLAEIHPDAVIGKDVSIEAFVRIDNDVIIGEGTWIGTGASIYPGARIGKNCKIYPGAVIAGIPQDLKFRGEYSTVEIGDYTSVREYVTISRGTASKGVTRVGSHTLLMAYAHVGHDSEVGNYCVLANGVQIAGEVVIDDWVVIGGLSAVHQFCRVGAHAMVSGMTGILSDVAPYTKVFGVPAHYVGVNAIGLKRRGFTNDQIHRIQDVYRVVYQGGMNVSQALEYLEMNLPNSDEKEFISSFIRNSERGIIKTVGANEAVPEVNSKFRKFTK